MRAIAGVCLLLFISIGCSTHVQQLSPTHTETPFYPPLARMAHITGQITLLITIDANGHVIDADATNDDKTHPLLKTAAIDNIRHWTFAKHPLGPYTQTITYNYEFDPSLHQDFKTKTKVKYHLPDRVTISTNLPVPMY